MFQNDTFWEKVGLQIVNLWWQIKQYDWRYIHIVLNVYYYVGEWDLPQPWNSIVVYPHNKLNVKRHQNPQRPSGKQNQLSFEKYFTVARIKIYIN